MALGTVRTQPIRRFTVNLRHTCLHVTQILKFEVRVQIYVAGLDFGCEIQKSAGDVLNFLKINSCEISF